MSENVGEVTRGKHPPWKPGESGNPAGRPKGARAKLAEDFLADLHEKWQERGIEAIDAVIEKRPHEFLRVVASLMPKQFKISDDRQGLSDEQRALRLVGIFRALHQGGNLDAALSGFGANGAGGPGDIRQPGNQQVIELQAVSKTDGVPPGGSNAPGAPVNGGKPSR